jgi:hypothetical protein
VNPRFTSAKSQLYGYGVQAAWRLGNWAELEECCAHHTESDFEVSIGKYVNISTQSCRNHNFINDRVLLNKKRGNDVQFNMALSQCRVELMASLSAASMESYQRAYPFVAKLHMLHELEQSLVLTIEGKEVSEQIIC